MIWVPGLMGSKLRVKVDCGKLKKARDTNPNAKEVLDKCSFMCWLWSRTYENTIWLNDKGWYYYMLWNDYNFIYKNRDCFFKMLIPEVKKKIVNQRDEKEVIVINTNGTNKSQRSSTAAETEFNRFRVPKEYQYYGDSRQKFLPAGQTEYPPSESKETGQVDPTYILQEMPIPGLEIRLWGDTDSTAKKANCGTNTVQSFMGDEDMQYGVVIENLEEMGYVSGITMQMTPFDFRKSAMTNNLVENMRLAIMQLRFFTGKKVVVAAHSYGNNVAMNAFNAYSQKFKDSHVEEFVAIGAPFLGSKAGLFYLLGVADWMYVQKIKEETHWDWLNNMFDGVNPHYAKILFPNLDALYEFIPDRGAVEYAYMEFLKHEQKLKSLQVSWDFIARVKQDAKATFALPSLLTFFEDKYREDDKIDPNHNPMDNNLEKVNRYFLRDIDQMMERFSISEFTNTKYRSFNTKGIRAYINPGVPTTVFFPEDIGTMGQLRLFTNTRKDFEEGRFPKYSVLNGRGDATVNLFSYGLPTLLWLADYATYSNINSTSPNTPQNQLQKGNWGVKNRLSLTPDGVTPKRIKMIELARGDPYLSTPYYNRIECKDWDKLGPERKRGEKPKPHIKTLMAGWNALIHEVDGVMDKIGKGDEDLGDALKNQVKEQLQNQLHGDENRILESSSKNDLGLYKSFPISKGKGRILGQAGDRYRRENLIPLYREYPFGSICCNHAMMVVNEQFMNEFKKILTRVGGNSESGGQEYRTAADEGLNYSKEGILDLLEDNKVYERHVENCPVIRCREGSDSCFFKMKADLAK